MQMLFKVIILFIVAGMGWLFYAIFVNLLMAANIIGEEFTPESFRLMTEKAVLIWIGCLVAGIFSLFVRKKQWHYLLLALPLAGPSLYALLYSISLS